MFNFFELFDINFISYLVTGELSPNIKHVFIYPDINTEYNSENKDQEFNEFNNYIDKLKQLSLYLIEKQSNVGYILRPFWNFASLKYESGVNNYSVAINIPFNYENLNKLRNYCKLLQGENFQDFLNHLVNRNLTSLSDFTSSLITEVNKSNINNVINNNYIKHLCQADNSELSDVKLIFLDCSKNGCSFIYVTNDCITYAECRSLLSFYSGALVSCFDNSGNLQKYLIIGTGLYHNHIGFFISQKLNLVEKSFLENIYVTYVSLFTKDFLKKQSWFLFRANAGISVYEMFISANKCMFNLASKHKVENYETTTNILKALKSLNILDVVCNIGNAKQKNHWNITKAEGNFSLNLSYGNFSLVLDSFQIMFNVFDSLNYSIKNFYHKDFVDFKKALENTDLLQQNKDLKSFFKNFKNTDLAYPAGMSAVFNKKKGLFYYSNRSFLNQGDRFISNNIAFYNISNSLINILLLPLSYMQLVVSNIRSYIHSGVYSVIRKSTKNVNIASSHYTCDLSKDFYNTEWKNADEFLTCDSLITYLCQKNATDVERLNLLFSHMVQNTINLPIIKYCRETRQGDNVFISIRNSNCSSCFYSFQKDKSTDIFIEGTLNMFNIDFIVQQLITQVGFTFIVSNELFGFYGGVESTPNFYRNKGFSFKYLVSLINTIKHHNYSVSTVIGSYSKNLDFFTDKKDINLTVKNEFILSGSSVYTMSGFYKDAVYIIPRLDIQYHNYDTVIHPLYGFASGCYRLYEVSKNMGKVQKYKGIFHFFDILDPKDNTSLFVDKNGLRDYYICYIMSVNHKEILKTDTFDLEYFNLFSAIGYEYGVQFAFPGIIPELNCFSHLRLQFIISQSYNLQLVLSFMTSPCLSSHISNKIFNRLFYNVHIHLRPY